MCIAALFLTLRKWWIFCWSWPSTTSPHCVHSSDPDRLLQKSGKGMSIKDLSPPTHPLARLRGHIEWGKFLWKVLYGLGICKQYTIYRSSSLRIECYRLHSFLKVLEADAFFFLSYFIVRIRKPHNNISEWGNENENIDKISLSLTHPCSRLSTTNISSNVSLLWSMIAVCRVQNRDSVF